MRQRAKTGLAVSYPLMERGNTVPYPPLKDEIRENNGFTDLRGRPDLVAIVPEASRSSALNVLLQRLAAPSSKIMTLGCDLGEHEENHRRSRRKVAGGYLQICSVPISENCRDELFAVCKMVEQAVSKDAASFNWRVEFGLCRTNFEFGPLIEGLSIWIWFFAVSAAADDARASREMLLLSIGDGLCLAAGLPASIRATFQEPGG